MNDRFSTFLLGDNNCITVNTILVYMYILNESYDTTEQYDQIVLVRKGGVCWEHL